jgi:hypothetical protein
MKITEFMLPKIVSLELLGKTTEIADSTSKFLEPNPLALNSSQFNVKSKKKKSLWLRANLNDL